MGKIVRFFIKSVISSARNNRKEKKSMRKRYRPICWQGGHAIRGKVYNWHGHIVCKKHYAWCCNNLRGIKNPQPSSQTGSTAGRSGFSWGWIVAIVLGVVLLLKLT